MALFKNLYMDLNFLNPFRKRKESVEQPMAQPLSEVPIPRKYSELPQVSKKLLGDKAVEEKSYTLPDIKPSIPKKDVAQPPMIVTNAPVSSRFSEDSFLNRGELSNNSFFSSLYSHISKEESFLQSNTPKEVLYKNLFNEMREFWQDKKDEMRKTVMSKAVKDELARRINDLHKMEIEWQQLQLQHEKIKDELASKEILIENSIHQLKKMFKKMHLHMKIKPEHHFVLAGGKRIESLSELMESLHSMDDEVFNYHVNNYKNDFANWVNDVMGLHDLANNLRSVKNKEQMYSVLEMWHR